MPVLSRTCPDAGQICAPFESPYRSETSSKKFSGYLNRPITIHGRSNGACARFSLINLLKHLNISQALLKGSTVYNWKTDRASADIDLQIFSESGGDKKLIEKLVEFLNSRSNHRTQSTQALQDKTWFSKVAHQLRDQWRRTIISVGYGQPPATTLDLNFTNIRTVSHDAIHASKAIQFNLCEPKAFIIDSWHPKLVEWLSEHQLLWFNPDIEEGLIRLSYRLSKMPESHLLQAGITTHFANKASEGNLRSICLRVLMNEYARNKLTLADRKQLWEPVIDAAAKPENEALKRDLLAWGKFNTLSQLRRALGQADTQQALLSRLTQGCQIGADFKSALKQTLKTSPEISARLKPVLAPALGASLIPGLSLFNKLDTWDHIQEVPEHELQTVFTGCLEELTKTLDEHICTRANNMLGWLNGDDLATLKFWLDRIPEASRQDPPESLMEPVLDAALQLIQKQGVEGLTDAVPQLSQLRIRQDHWHTLARALMNTLPASAPASSVASDDLTIQLMRLLVRNSPLLAAFIPDSKVDLEGNDTSMPTQQFHTQAMAFVDNINKQKIPPALKSIVCINRNDVEIKLPDLILTLSKSQRTAVATLGSVKHWVNENSYAVLQPTAPGSGPALQMMWRDGAMFSGQQTANGNFSFNGLLSQISKPGTSNGLSGLLQSGRVLAGNLFHNVDLQNSHWRCNGLFSGQQLLKADCLEQALLALKNGCIREQSSGSGLLIEHHVKDNRPEHCSVSAHTARSTVELKMSYRQGTSMNNPWRVEPEFNTIESICRLNSPPFGDLEFTTRLPWNEQTQSSVGVGEVTVKGTNPFKWLGRFESGKLLPEGKLFLDRQKTPAIQFNHNTPSATIPMTLLPVMADLLGKHATGKYRFTPKVWSAHDQWPDDGFEGFVNLLPCGGNYFSGYITSTGQALGVLSEVARADSVHFSAWTGSFMIQAAPMMKPDDLPLDIPTTSQLTMQLPNGKVLLPHGVVNKHTMARFESRPKSKEGQLFFRGENIPYGQITQHNAVQYHSPGKPQYFVGLNYTQNNKPKQIDIVFNPGDGGHDFIIIRPQHYDKLSDYQEIYRDSEGVQASWLVADGRYQMGQIRLPSGIEYSGQIKLHNEQFNLLGKGKFSLGRLLFTGEFTTDSTVNKLKGMNPESTHWVNQYCGDAGKRTFPLNEWLEIISGGRLNWNSDVKAHLRCRNVAAIKNSATVFSRT